MVLSFGGQICEEINVSGPPAQCACVLLNVCMIQGIVLRKENDFETLPMKKNRSGMR